MGFDCRDDTQATPIVSVELLSGDTVRLHLAQPPGGANPRVTYAMNLQVNASYGATAPGSGHGNLRDSDTTTLGSGTPLHNWAIHASIPVATAP